MPRRPHMLQELGFAVRQDGEDLRGTASVTPYMRVPGTECLRASILASWADMVCGLLSMRAFAGQVSVTLELDVHLYRPAPGSGTVTAVGRQVKAGRSVFVGEVEFADARGEAFGFSAASFMVAPDTTLRPPRLSSLEIPPQDARLSMPLAERADCKRQAPGVAVLHKSEDGLNSAKTVHGGLIALAAEESVLSLAPGTSLSSLALRYLQPVRVGPAVATARVRDGLGRVELRDSGSADRLAMTATTRSF
jgi:acyl-coenzyme A thioesterase PaaI-like protein